MLPTFKDLDVTVYFIIFSAVFLLTIIIFKKNIWNILDPFIYTLLNLSFNLAIVFYSLVKNDIKIEYVYYCIISFICFCIAMKLSMYVSKTYIQSPSKVVFKGPNRTLTIILLVFSMFLFTINNIYLISKIGLGIINGQANPDILKVTLTQGGGGVFQKISIASQIIFVPLLAHAYYTFKLKKTVLISFCYYLICMFFFNFSKSGLLFMLFNLGIVLHYYEYYLGYKIIKLKKIIFFAGIALISALVVLSNVSSNYGLNISELLLDRFIATGGGTYQYFVLSGAKVLDKLSFVDKLNNYFDVFLSSLKLKEWEPLGYIAKMTKYLTGLNLPGFGANPYMFLDGHFLFGWFGTIYCGCLGAIIGLIRTVNSGFLNFFIANYIVLQFVSDPGTAQHNIIALFFFVPILMVFKIVSDLKDKSTTIKFIKN